MKVIPRETHVRNLARLLRENPVVALLGARQVGKTTLARELIQQRRGPATWFDLEQPRDLRQLDEPTLALEPLRGLVVLDEVQNRPELFPVLRVLADRSPRPARFLVLGSASPELLRQGSETLAGRIAFYELPGFDLAEVEPSNWQRLWLRGGFPRAYLPRAHRQSGEWRANFVRTFVERDLPRLGALTSPRTLADFWTMMSHYHGQVWNSSELGRAFGVAHTTVRGYLNLLTDTFVVRQLPPWTENIGKRVVKSPKVYVADSGLLHTLLGIEKPADLTSHPKVGASFEGFALEQVIRRLDLRPREAFFWATHSGAELDLLVIRGRRRLGFEFKRTDAPRLTRSMTVSLDTLGLDRIDVIHAGSHGFRMHDKVRAVPIQEVLEALKPLA
ncbi:MAG: ATP-binding protein [Chromatiales bacterium]|nr:ATP-binding protein [Chromatiales bacterium]